MTDNNIFKLSQPGIFTVKYPYLNLARRRAKARARPIRNKRAHMVPAIELFRLGLTLMERAETGKFGWEMWRSCLYRDGLMITLLACRQIRLANLAGLRIGVDFMKNGSSYQIALDGADTKNHRPYERPLASALTPYIERYLDHYRPHLLGTGQTDLLWLTNLGTRMSDNAIYQQIVHHTMKAFGRSVSPHLFRDCAVTSLGEENPELVWLSMSLLHHSDPRIAEKHYDHASASHAVREYQKSVSAQRQRVVADRSRKLRFKRSA